MSDESTGGEPTSTPPAEDDAGTPASEPSEGTEGSTDGENAGKAPSDDEG